MQRRVSLTTSTRASDVALAADDAWVIVASGRRGPQWYVDAAPFVVRGAIDRAVGGGGRRWDPPGTALLVAGDRGGFWEVTTAEHDSAVRRLVLEARVRTPGRVTLETTLCPDGPGRCRLHQSTTLDPAGALGAAYLWFDLPARETVLELAHRRLLSDLYAAAGTPRPGG